MATFSERIKELRTESNLNQEELGNLIGVQKNTVSRWETGSNPPSEENCLLLAHYFKVPYAYLLGVTDDRQELCLTDEEEAEKRKLEAKQDEDQMLGLYRKLSPEMQKMIRTMVGQAYLIDRERKDR